MTVAELIKELEQYPQDARVVVPDALETELPYTDVICTSLGYWTLSDGYCDDEGYEEDGVDGATVAGNIRAVSIF